jgi:hypothetical protein
LIKATNTSTTGAAYGLVGQTASTDGYAVHGFCTATTGNTRGVYGDVLSDTGTGVRGVASATSGATKGVVGRAYSSGNSSGVYGYNSASSGTTYGVYGSAASPSGYGVYYSGGLGGTGAMKLVVLTSRGPTGLDAMTSAGNWVEDFGEGRLVGGRCHIELDPLFIETVTIDEEYPMKVYVTPNGPLGEWWVEKGIADFVLVAHDAPDGTMFDYRIVAKRKGFEDIRLDNCKAANTDAYLFPELRENIVRD